MKIKTRLVLAFCIIIFVPLIVIFTAYILLGFSNFTNERLIRLQESLSGLSVDVVASGALILVLTATILILWIYNGVVPSIRKLTKAADCIKEGDLDFSISGTGVDELSELCNTFEEMRIRLQTTAKERLEEEAEQKMLISNIAHDLKTPITAIKGYSEGLLDGVANNPKMQEEYVRTILSKANEMDNLIDELTLYSNLDTSRIPYNFQKINISDYCENYTCDIAMDLSHKNIEFTYLNHLAKDIICIIDTEQLGRAFNNIVNNSVKYKGDNALKITFTVHDAGDFVQIDIKDNGIGISRSNLPHVFDRMYRGDQSRSTTAGGSGIGLSIVKRIIEDHGGRIWASSIEGKGTTMSIVLRKYVVSQGE